MGTVIEVDWLLRESDGKLTHVGCRGVTKRPRQTLMVEVDDANMGIQSEQLLRRCEHLAAMMNVRGITSCEQESSGLPSAS